MLGCARQPGFRGPRLDLAAVMIVSISRLKVSMCRCLLNAEPRVPAEFWPLGPEW